MSPKQRRTLFAVALVNISSFASQAILLPFFPKEAEQKGLSPSVYGLVFFIDPFMMLISSPVLSRVISHVEPRAVLIFGLLFNGFANIVFGFMNQVQSEELFILGCMVSRAISGISTTALNINLVFLSAAFPNNINKAVAAMQMFTGIGTTIGGPIGGLVYDFSGFGLPFWLIGGFMLGVVPVVLVCISRLPPTSNQHSNLDSFWKLIKSRIVLSYLWFTFLFSVGWAFLDPILEPAMRAKFGASSTTLGLLAFAYSFAYLLTPVWVWLVELIRIGTTWSLILIGCCGSGLAFLFLGGPSPLNLPDTLWVDALALVVFGATAGLGFVPTYGSILDNARARGFSDDVRTSGLVTGMWNIFHALGEFCGPVLGTVLSEHNSFGVACTIVSLFFFITAALVLLHVGSERCRRTPQIDNERSYDGLIGEPVRKASFGRITPIPNLHQRFFLVSIEEVTPLLVAPTEPLPSSSLS